MSRVGWLDCSTGVSGDMLAGALHQLGALDQLPEVVASLGLDGLRVDATDAVSHGMAARRFAVQAPAEQPLRRLDDVHRILDGAALPAEVRDRATRVFGRLAEAEALVHGTAPSEVHFHEVGAIDSIVDVLAGCLGLHTLGLDELVVSPVALGGGSVSTGHGTLPVPGPAVLRLLAGSGLSAYGGPVDAELATPTGVALLAEWATGSGPLPELAVARVGVGAGSRELPDRPNVLRLVLGQSTATDTAATAGDAAEGWRTVAANVDDLDPRLWPGVIDALLAAGAVDAWLSPIQMKKGRPAHTLHALVRAATLDAVVAAAFATTSTIGLRVVDAGKIALDRELSTVQVGDLAIRVKVAVADGRIVTATPEWVDVAAAATALGIPEREVLERARVAAAALLDGAAGEG